MTTLASVPEEARTLKRHDTIAVWLQQLARRASAAA
jgi:hypothetical protein